MLAKECLGNIRIDPISVTHALTVAVRPEGCHTNNGIRLGGIESRSTRIAEAGSTGAFDTAVIGQLQNVASSFYSCASLTAKLVCLPHPALPRSKFRVPSIYLLRLSPHLFEYPT